VCNTRVREESHVREFLKSREEQGAYNVLLYDLKLEEGSFGFNNYLQMSPENFELLLSLVCPLIEK
jgi:hypothetical protein